MDSQPMPSSQEENVNGSAIKTQKLPNSIWSRTQQDNIAFLHQVPLFRGLPESQLKMLASRMEELKFQKQEPIIRHGEPNDHIYFIKNGIVGVTRVSEEGQQEEILSYFHQNHIFGEFGLFSGEQHIATATVTALSEVNLLRMEHSAFTDVLSDYHPAAMEVARILTKRLQAPSDQLVPPPDDQKLYLVMGLNKGAGMTTVGSALTAALSKREGEPVVYTEYPNGYELPKIFGFAATEFYSHPEGFDIFVPQSMPRLAPAVNVNLILERIQKRYNTIVVGIPSKLIHEMGDLMEKVSRVILVASPGRWEDLQEMAELLHTSAFLTDDKVIQVANYPIVEYMNHPDPEGAEFKVPFLVAMNLASIKNEGLPEPLAEVANSLAGYLVSQNRVDIYLPTNFVRESGETADTNAAAEKIMWFLKEQFGDVSRRELDDDAYLISSDVSFADLNAKWPQLLENVGQSKEMINQDTIVVEINRNLVLV